MKDIAPVKRDRREYQKKYYLQNIQRIKENRRLHYLNNKDAYKERAYKFRAANPDKIKAYQEKYINMRNNKNEKPE